MLYVGLDVHASRSSLCILNDGGAVVNRQEIIGPWSQGHRSCAFLRNNRFLRLRDRVCGDSLIDRSRSFAV